MLGQFDANYKDPYRVVDAEGSLSVATLAPKVSYRVGKSVFYGKVGAAVTYFDSELARNFFGTVGIEYVLPGNLTGRVEYQRMEDITTGPFAYMSNDALYFGLSFLLVKR